MKSIPIVASVDVSSRRKRRAATILVIELLDKIYLAEEKYQSNIPFNLQESAAYAAANETIDSLIDAMLILDAAFD